MRRRWTISGSLLIAAGVVACSGIDFFPFDFKDPPDGSGTTSCNGAARACEKDVDCVSYVYSFDALAAPACLPFAVCGGGGYCVKGPPLDGKACTSTTGQAGMCVSDLCLVSVDASADGPFDALVDAEMVDAADDADSGD